MRYQASADPVTAELLQIGREIMRLRRHLVILYGALIAGTVVTLERVLHGFGPRFVVDWVGVFVASLAAVYLTRNTRASLAILDRRLRVLGR